MFSAKNGHLYRVRKSYCEAFKVLIFHSWLVNYYFSNFVFHICLHCQNFFVRTKKDPRQVIQLLIAWYRGLQVFVRKCRRKKGNQRGKKSRLNVVSRQTSVRPFVRPSSVRPSIRPSVRPSVCLSVCPSVHLSVCLSKPLTLERTEN